MQEGGGDAAEPRGRTARQVDRLERAVGLAAYDDEVDEVRWLSPSDARTLLTYPSDRQLVAAARGNGVLTIAEADPACRSQAMFCMVYEPRAVSFRMNLDAIARSGLRVDPRVLRLAEGGR